MSRLLGATGSWTTAEAKCGRGDKIQPQKPSVSRTPPATKQGRVGRAPEPGPIRQGCFQVSRHRKTHPSDRQLYPSWLLHRKHSAASTPRLAKSHPSCTLNLGGDFGRLGMSTLAKTASNNDLGSVPKRRPAAVLLSDFLMKKL